MIILTGIIRKLGCVSSYLPSIVTMARVYSEIKQDIGRKSWFFHTPLHSTLPLGGGVPVGVLPCCRCCPSVRLSVCRQNAKNAIFFQKTKQFGLYWRPIWSRAWAFQRTHYGTHKIQDGGDPPSWILTPNCKNAIFWKTMQFRAMVSTVDYRKLLVP